jgi:hypothetical protein
VRERSGYNDQGRVVNIPEIPPSRLLSIQNLTPFNFFKCHKMAPRRRYADVTVVKGTFELTPGTLELKTPAAEPIVPADHYWDGNAGVRASVKKAGDLVLYKPGTDVIVTGTAHAPRGRPARAWDVGVTVRDASSIRARLELCANGPRRFEHRGMMRGWTVSDPEPATSAPIRYELAYGGVYTERRAGEPERARVHEPNPSGVGFCDADALDKSRTYEAPRWELRDQPVTTVNCDAPLAGLGPLARHWLARRVYAGTYDDAWERDWREGLERRLPPDYARDFDARFFQSAHPSLVSAQHLRGDERLELTGLLEGAEHFATALPGTSIFASVSSGAPPWRELRLPLDTVHVDLDARRVSLVWRLSIDHEQDIRAVVLYVEGEA